jgi:addiction module HigA family antidote
MDSAHSTLYEPIAALHPGTTVAEYLDFQGWSQQDLARRTGLTPKTISEICNGKAPITPPTSLAFEKVLQRPAHFWLNLQRQFDEAKRAPMSDPCRLGTGPKVPLKELRMTPSTFYGKRAL